MDPELMAQLNPMTDGVILLLEIAKFIILMGAALIIGGVWHQIKEQRKNVTPGMFLGSIVQAVGVVLFSVTLVVQDLVPDAAHLVVYGLIAVGLLALGFVYRKATKDVMWVWATMGALATAWVALMIWWQFLTPEFIGEAIARAAAAL